MPRRMAGCAPAFICRDKKGYVSASLVLKARLVRAVLRDITKLVETLAGALA
jgi:hypothetical protein